MSFIHFGLDRSAVPLTIDADPIRQLRQLTLVPSESLQFVRAHDVSSKAFTTLDFDGDGNDEISVCSLGGELAIYKLSDNAPWKCAVCPLKLGSVASVVSGDVRNQNTDSLVVLTAEGNGFLFEWDTKFIEKVTKSTESNGRVSNIKADLFIRPSLQFSVPYNVSTALVSKIGNEFNLIVGTNDRKVHALAFEDGEKSQKYVWNLREQVTSLCRSFEESNAILGRAEVPIIVAGLQGGIYARISLHTGLTGVSYFGSNLTNQTALDKTTEETEVESTDSDLEEEPPSSLPGFGGGMIAYEISRKANLSTSVTIVGGPIRLPESAIACGNFEGILSIQKEGEILWDIYLGHPIFSVQVIDVTGDGNQEIVAACWDGFVFICNYERHVVSFQTVEDAICGFTVGEMKCENRKIPFLAFAALSSNIYIYSDFNLPSLQHKTLISHLKPQFAAKNLTKDWSKSEKITFIESCCRFPWSETESEEIILKLRDDLRRTQ